MALFCFNSPLQAQSQVSHSFSWIASPATRDCLQLALDLVASPDSQAYVERLFSLCGDLTAKHGTGCPCKGGYFWNWTVTFCIELCERKWNLFSVLYRTAEDKLHIVHFWFSPTYLVISLTTLTYMSKLKRKCRQNCNWDENRTKTKTTTETSA